MLPFLALWCTTPGKIRGGVGAVQYDGLACEGDTAVGNRGLGEFDDWIIRPRSMFFKSISDFEVGSRAGDAASVSDCIVVEGVGRFWTQVVDTRE